MREIATAEDPGSMNTSIRDVISGIAESHANDPLCRSARSRHH